MGTRTKRATTTEAQQMLELLNSLGGTIFRQLLWQRQSDLDLTYAQSQVLVRLAEHPGSHMGDVAKAFGVTLPAVTHIVDRLEEKGWVRRERCEHDRRQVLCWISPAGLKLLDSMSEVVERADQVAVSGLRPAEQRRLVSLLGQVVEDEIKGAS